MKNKFLFLSLLLCFVAANVKAQTNIIDEVIWIVGDQSILRSEVEEQRLRAQLEGTPIEGDPYCVIPEQIALNKLFLHQAKFDSIEVSESTVISQVEYRINYIIAQIGSKEKMEEYFGKSTSEIREYFQDLTRDQLTTQQVQQKLVGDIKSTPADVRRFYNSLDQDSIPTVAAQVELQIISFQPLVPIAETNRIKERLREFTNRVNSGTTDFALLARLYSEDIESAKRGGELGFMGRGQLVPEFSTVAFNLQDTKKVSRIVQTEFGYHIIQLIEKRGDRINCRHILLKPRISSEDKNIAVKRLDSIANDIRNEKMTFEQAVVYFSQDKNTAMNAGLMYNEKSGTSRFEYQDLPQEVGKMAYNMKVGEISDPFAMIDQSTNKEVVAVIKVKSKTGNHKANLTTDYQLLKNLYEGKEKEKFLKEWIVKKQKETYISIDPEWQNCKFQYPGWIKN